MSKVFDYLKFGFDIRADETELQEIRNIVLEEAGFKWIPVMSERLPEPEETGSIWSTNVFVSTEVDIFDAFYDYELSCWREYHHPNTVIPDVIAWMPLPKPYEPNP